LIILKPPEVGLKMKKYLKNILIIGLFLTALGGLGLHYRIHSIVKNAYAYIPFIAGLISVIAIPLLFLFRKTLHLAYILNGFTVIIGVITMAHFSLVKAPLLPDIAILLGKFFIGRAIFVAEIYQLETEAKTPDVLRWIRYPNMGFWAVHLVLLSAVYYLGNLLWR
jgi:hypothetical protein